MLFLTIGSATSAPDGSSPRGCAQLDSWAQAPNNCPTVLLQPYYRQLVEGAAAFVRLEQENFRLQAALDQMTRKFSSLLLSGLSFFQTLLIESL